LVPWNGIRDAGAAHVVYGPFGNEILDLALDQELLLMSFVEEDRPRASHANGHPMSDGDARSPGRCDDHASERTLGTVLRCSGSAAGGSSVIGTFLSGSLGGVVARNALGH
jgi:hypothetical protein